MNHIGIDVRTKSKHLLIVRLRGLVSTVSVRDGGVYHEDTSYSQVWLDTSKTKEEVDDWLYKLHPSSGVDYVGTFTRLNGLVRNQFNAQALLAKLLEENESPNTIVR